MLFWRSNLTPATANSSFLLSIMLLDCRSLTEMFRTPVGNFRSILLASGVLFSKSAAVHTQKPRAVVPKMWCSVSLKLNWSRKSSPSRILPLHHSTWPDSNSLLEASWQFRPFLLLPAGWSSTGTLFLKNWKEEFFCKNDFVDYLEFVIYSSIWRR